MDVTAGDGPGGFARQVRSALAHLYDPVYLQTHPLARALGAPPSGVHEDEAVRVQAGRALRRRLLDAIARLRPEGKGGEEPGAARAHRLLELRYVEALAPAAVQEHLGVEKSQYYREHARALAAVVSLVAHEWPCAGSPAGGRRPGRAPAAGPPLPAGVSPGDLPTSLTSFVGRERELAEVGVLLEQRRLVTLTGPGGVGKTRLALEAARAAGGAFPDGVAFVPLAALVDPDLVPVAAAQALGVRETADRSPLSALLVALRGARLLLLLDNCEHLAAACAGLADALLRACAHVAILATSRAALGIAGEVPWRVPSLSVPDAPGGAGPPAALARHDAVRLFADRAGTVQPAFAVTEQNAATVVRLCRRLDGIPLALELAAARVRVLTVDELLRRLDDRFRLLTGGGRTAPPRHQTLRALVAWSYDLLDAPARRLFDRLGVFAGSFTLAAAERVGAGEGLAAEEVLDALTRLVDQSLVQPEPGPDGVGRYRLLETLRQYARERLAAAGGAADAVRERHARFFLALAETAEPRLAAAELGPWLDRLDTEHDNLREALAWSQGAPGAAAGPDPLGLRLAAALWWFWWRRSHWSEGRRWLEGALALPAVAARTPARATALYGAGRLAAAQGDHAAARARLEASVALWRELGDRRGLAWALQGLGWPLLTLGADAPARAALEESAALFRELGDREGLAYALRWLGNAAAGWGRGTGPQEREAAVALWEESLALFRELGDDFGTALPLLNLAGVARQRGDYAAARRLLEETVALRRTAAPRGNLAAALYGLSDVVGIEGDGERAERLVAEALALFREAGNRDMAAGALTRLGELARRRGDRARAEAFYREGLELARQVRSLGPVVCALGGLADVARRRGDLRRARSLYAEAVGLVLAPAPHAGLSVDTGTAGARSLVGLAGLEAARARPDRAARLLGAAHALLEALGSPFEPPDAADQAAEVGAARAAMGAPAFAAAFAAGQAMTLEQAVADALEETQDDA